MRCVPLLLGLLSLVGSGNDQVGGEQAEAPHALAAGAEKLRGVWKLAKPPKGRYLWLRFDGDTLGITSAVATNTLTTKEGQVVQVKGGVVVQGRERFSGMQRKEQGEKHVISFGDKQGEVSAITYRLDSDTLVIEEGSCRLFDQLRGTGDYLTVPLKGDWKRLGGDVEKLQGEWIPIKPQEGAIVSVVFHMELFTLCARSKDKFACETVLYELAERDKKRVLTPVGKADWISNVTYRFDRGSLVIEAGECAIIRKESLKGVWKLAPRIRR